MRKRSFGPAVVAAQRSVVANVTTARQQTAAAVPKQQTGNEHLDGKLKIIGENLTQRVLLTRCVTR